MSLNNKSEQHKTLQTITDISGKLGIVTTEVLEDDSRKYIYYPVGGEYSKSRSYADMKCGIYR